MNDEIRIDAAKADQPRLLEVTDLEGSTATLTIDDLRAALDDWSGCYEAEGFNIEHQPVAEIYRRLRKFVEITEAYLKAETLPGR